MSINFLENCGYFKIKFTSYMLCVLIKIKEHGKPFTLVRAYRRAFCRFGPLASEMFAKNLHANDDQHTHHELEKGKSKIKS